jgi:hypothetical protein
MQNIAVTWSGHTLDVGRIEAEMDRLRFLAAGEPDGGHALAARASVLNMVVYAEHEEVPTTRRLIEDPARTTRRVRFSSRDRATSRLNSGGPPRTATGAT